MSCLIFFGLKLKWWRSIQRVLKILPNFISLNKTVKTNQKIKKKSCLLLQLHIKNFEFSGYIQSKRYVNLKFTNCYIF